MAAINARMHVTVTVSIHGLWRYRFRIWITKRLVALASWVLSGDTGIRIRGK